MNQATAITYLFVPADRPERFEKAVATGVDAVVIDLEDAVAPENKADGRRNVQDAIGRGLSFVLRINGAETDAHGEDLAAIADAPPAAFMLARAERAESLLRLAARFPQTPLIPLIETGAGLANARALAAGPNVARLAFGSFDFKLDMGISDDGDGLLPARFELVLASRLAGIARPIDGVSAGFEGPDFEADVLRARQLGFGGKLCIHPKQVAGVKAGFRPSEQEIERARRIVAAADASDGGAISLDGQMIDRPVVELARRQIAEAGNA